MSHVPGATDTEAARQQGTAAEPAAPRVMPARASHVRWASQVAAVLSVVWVYRAALFEGRLPGNIGDARWTIAVHDHWYRVWQGLDGVRDLLFYYPLRTTLGTSDGFLVQGQIYSLARLLGLGIVNAWLVATIGFALIGAVGVAVLSRRLLAGVAAQVAFVVLGICSYAAIVTVGHPQLIGFLAGSWVVLGFLDVREGRTLRGLWVLAVASPLLAMSSWYAVVLLAVPLVFLAALLLLLGDGVGRRSRTVVGEVLATVRTPRGAGAVVVGAVGWLATMWIYLPSAGLLPAPVWNEVVIYSPRWSDVWNASGDGGGLWAPLYRHLYPAGSYNSEQQLGFTPVLFLALVVATLVLVRLGRSAPAERAGTDGRPGRDAVLAAALTCAVTIAFFLVDERGLGLFRPFWSHVPGVTSIRAPYRVMIYLYPLAVFVVVRTAELVAPRVRMARRRLGAGLVAVLLLAVFVEMQRPVEMAWGRADLLPAALTSRTSTVDRSCDAVIVGRGSAADPTYETAVDAVIFSVVSGVPTPQGYSRADPRRYPGVLGTPRRFSRWMDRHGFDGRLCRVTARGVRPIAAVP